MNKSEHRKLSFRNEKKYLLDNADAELLKQRLKGMLATDANANASGVYKIRSVYFDDYWNTAYEDKVNGLSSRCKYRIRVYNDDETVIHLERKIKRDAYVSKQMAVLTRDAAERLIQGDYAFLLHDPQPLCREFYCECAMKLMRPCVTVDYVRQPYVFEAGDVRITFDMDVQAAVLKYDLFDSDLPVVNVLKEGQTILEVKYTEFLPAFIKQALPAGESQAISLSKFVLAYDKTMFLRASDCGWQGN